MTPWRWVSAPSFLTFRSIARSKIQVTRFFDPHDPADLYVAMADVSVLPRNEVSLQSMEEIGRMRLRECGRVLLSAYDRVATSPVARSPHEPSLRPNA